MGISLSFSSNDLFFKGCVHSHLAYLKNHCRGNGKNRPSNNFSFFGLPRWNHLHSLWKEIDRTNSSEIIWFGLKKWPYTCYYLNALSILVFWRIYLVYGNLLRCHTDYTPSFFCTKIKKYLQNVVIAEVTQWGWYFHFSKS